MKERIQLVTLYETGKYSVMELAEYFKVSRKTAYKWLDTPCREISQVGPQCNLQLKKCYRCG